jgi:hypothetical protein
LVGVGSASVGSGVGDAASTALVGPATVGFSGAGVGVKMMITGVGVGGGSVGSGVVPQPATMLANTPSKTSNTSILFI